MAFCPNCGTKTDGSFCPNCGSPVSGTGASAGGTGYVPPRSPSGVQAPGLTENVASALCYLVGLITGIIFLLISPYNRNKTIRFHAFQAIFGHIALIIMSIVLGMFSVATRSFGFPLVRLFWLLAMLLWLYMMYTAYNNRKVKLPFIGDLAEKQA